MTLRHTTLANLTRRPGKPPFPGGEIKTGALRLTGVPNPTPAVNFSDCAGSQQFPTLQR